MKTSRKVFAARGRATFLIVAVFLLSPRDLRAASFKSTLEYRTGSRLASESVVLPTSRDLVIPEAIDADGNPIPEHIAHCLFTRAIEEKIRDQRAQANLVGAAAANVVYQGGPVMEGNLIIYLVFYRPPRSKRFPPGFVDGIKTFFVHASGSPFSAIMTQYPDKLGIAPAGTFTVDGVYVDSTTRPASGRAGTETSPLLDSDVQNEIVTAYKANPSWLAPGLSVLYEVFTAPNVWERGPAGKLSFNSFCGYHSMGYDPNLDSNSYPYAFLPYADSTDANGAPVGCGGNGRIFT